MIEKISIARNYCSYTSLCIAIAALPFSVSVCHGGIILFLICWLAEGEFKIKLERFKENLLLKILVSFVLLNMIGIAYTSDVSNGWYSIDKKIFLLLLPVALASTSLTLDEKKIQLLVNTFILSCLAGSVICVANAIIQLQAMNDGNALTVSTEYLSSSNFATLNPAASPKWFVFTYIALAEGISIHPTYFALYISFCICLLASNYYKNDSSTKQNALRVALLIYFSVFVICLASRIMIIALLFILVASTFYFFVGGVHKKTAIALLTLLCALIFLLYSNPVTRYRNLQEITGQTFNILPNHQYTDAAQIRASLWWLAAKSFGDVNPLVGTGSGDVSSLMKLTSEKFKITNVISTNDPHNQFLFSFLGSGGIGLFLLISCFTLLLYKSWQQHDYLLLSFTFLIICVCITESALEIQKGIMFFAIFCPLLAFQRKTSLVSDRTLNLSGND